MPSGETRDVVIVGAGPAGAALALLLKRAGHRVAVVGRRRDYRAIEGITRRTLQALHDLGLARACACAVGPVARRVEWAGEPRAPNHEWLLPRPDFDAALLTDLAAADIELIEGRARRLDSQDTSATVTLEGPPERAITARWAVDARGRAAARRLYRDGAPWSTPAWILRAEADSDAPASCALSLAGGGWAWWSRVHGQQYLQLALPEAQLPDARAAPRAWLATRPELGTLWQDAPITHHYLRPTTLGRTRVRQGRVWRLGDAAMAIDPLSGQGIFNALSSAHGLLPVLEGLLAGEPLAPLERFHQRRQDLMYWRFARAGRDFYRQAAVDDPSPYWQMRCHWPDLQPMHAPEPWSRIRLADGPAIVGRHLVSRRLVVTPDQPLGIQAVAGVPLAPIVEAMQGGDTPRASRLLQQAGGAGDGLHRWWADHPDWPALPASPASQ